MLTAVGAAAVLAFAVAIWRGQSWGRSGGIVTQLLILAVALGAVTGAYADRDGTGCSPLPGARHARAARASRCAPPDATRGTRHPP